MKNTRLLLASLLLLSSPVVVASSIADGEWIDLTDHFIGYLAIFIFTAAYTAVIAEGYIQLRKSQPVILAAGIIWISIAFIYTQHDIPHIAEKAVRHYLLEYAELMFFLLIAMTYISSLEERKVFDTLRCWLINKGFSFRQLFWITGFLSFFISPIADNLTTALLMCAVVMSVAADNDRFVAISCVNIVVAANAGGAFSPFGDITTLMVWQKGVLEFQAFILLFIPSVVNYLVPATIMNFFIPDGKPANLNDQEQMKRGARIIFLLFLITILMAISFHSLLHLPPVMGMFTGFSLLQLYGFYLNKTHNLKEVPYNKSDAEKRVGDITITPDRKERRKGYVIRFDAFLNVSRAEWDTLFFFYGVVLCVGGLGFIGYLNLASNIMYHQWGATSANIAVGFLSALIDNIPIMFAVLTMMPDMSQGQWLLVTLTAGVGGSMLSIGSAAGIALMGVAKDKYTFFSHLKWTPVIVLGYAASILTHLWMNHLYF